MTTTFFKPEQYEIQGHTLTLRPVSIGDLKTVKEMDDPLGGVAHIVHRTVCDDDGALMFSDAQAAAEGMPLDLQAEIVKTVTEAAYNKLDTGDPLPGQSSRSRNGGESRSQRRRRQRQGKS